MAYTTIDDSSAYFQVMTYTGNGTGRTITNDGNSDMQPDLVWIKNLSAPDGHVWVDSLRGATKRFETENGVAEVTEAQSVTSFSSDGFGIGTDADVNENNENYVAWLWKKGSTPGIDMKLYTGTQAALTITHSCGAVPKLVIVKCRSLGRSWCVYHHETGADPNDMVLHLNTTAAAVDYGAEYWNGTDPTSTEWYTQAAHDTNKTDETFIVYLFAEIQGFSRIGLFTGNGDTDGTFVNTGFKPSFILMKEHDAVTGWGVWDNRHSGTYNPRSSLIQPNSIAVPYTGSSYAIDFLSNGFKIRHNDGAYNGDDDPYIYAAFAENPLVTSGGVPATAE